VPPVQPAQPESLRLTPITETAWLARLAPAGDRTGQFEFHLGAIHEARSDRAIGLEAYAATGDRETVGLGARFRFGTAARSLEVAPRIGLWKSNGLYRGPMPGVGVSYGSSRAAVLAMVNMARQRSNPDFRASAWSGALHLGARVGEGPGLAGVAIGAAFFLVVGALASQGT
jgi:hypothetical protein